MQTDRRVWHSYTYAGIEAGYQTQHMVTPYQLPEHVHVWEWSVNGAYLSLQSTLVCLHTYVFTCNTHACTPTCMHTEMHSGSLKNALRFQSVVVHFRTIEIMQKNSLHLGVYSEQEFGYIYMYVHNNNTEHNGSYQFNGV